MQRRQYLRACGALVTAASLPARAGVRYPTRPVRIIVPQTPAGASDKLARILAQKLSKAWGQPVLVRNRPGAGGNVGMQAVLAAPVDGYTLLMCYVGTQAINGSLYKNLSFDPGRDFVAIATVATVPYVIVAKPGAPFHGAGDLVQAARTGRVRYASAGNGSVNHLLGEMFGKAAGVQLFHQPYRGATAAVQAVLAGQVEVFFGSLPSVAEKVRKRGLQAVAITSASRLAAFPEIPTIAESGLAGFDIKPWFGLVGHRHMPRVLVARINGDVNAVLRQPDVVERFAALGAVPLAQSPAEFAAQLAADVQKWGAVVRASGARID